MAQFEKSGDLCGMEKTPESGKEAASGKKKSRKEVNKKRDRYKKSMVKRAGK